MDADQVLDIDALLLEGTSAAAAAEEGEEEQPDWRLEPVLDPEQADEIDRLLELACAEQLGSSPEVFDSQPPPPADRGPHPRYWNTRCETEEERLLFDAQMIAKQKRTPRPLLEVNYPVPVCQVMDLDRMTALLYRMAFLAGETHLHLARGRHPFYYLPYSLAFLSNLEAFAAVSSTDLIHQLADSAAPFGLCLPNVTEDGGRRYTARQRLAQLKKTAPQLIRRARLHPLFLQTVRIHLMNIVGIWMYADPTEEALRERSNKTKKRDPIDYDESSCNCYNFSTLSLPPLQDGDEMP